MITYTDNKAHKYFSILAILGLFFLEKRTLANFLAEALELICFQ